MIQLCTAILFVLSVSAFALDERFNSPWPEIPDKGKVRRTEKPLVFLVARSASFETQVEAEAFAQKSTESKVVEIKPKWVVTYFEEFDLSFLFSPDEQAQWKTGVRNYALWIVFNAKHKSVDYIRDGKVFYQQPAQWEVHAAADVVNRMKLSDTIVRSEIFKEGERQYVRTTYEVEIPLKSAAEEQFMAYTRSMEHLLLRQINDGAVSQPSMRPHIECEIYRLPGFVVRTTHSAGNRDGMSVECSVLEDRSAALQLLVRLFLVPKNFASKPQPREINGNTVLATADSIAWITQDNRVYMTWGDSKNAIRGEYLKAFPSALDKSFNFEHWIHREVDLALTQMRVSIAGGDYQKYFWAYLYLSRFVKTDSGSPVLGPPYYEGVTLDVARWHCKRVERWLERIKNKQESFIFNTVPVCYRDALASTVSWRNVGPDWLGAAAADLDLAAYQNQQKEAQLALRRLIPADDELRQSARLKMAAYLEQDVKQKPEYLRNLKRDEDAWSYEWKDAFNNWHLVRIGGPEILVNRTDPTSASAIFTGSGKGIATVKYYFRFDTLKKVWGECRLTP